MLLRWEMNLDVINVEFRHFIPFQIQDDLSNQSF